MTQKQFQTLKAQWYRKLARAGFNDIETETGELKKPNRPALRAATAIRPFDLSSKRHDIVSQLSEAARREYYRLAGHCLWDKRFESKLDKKVWALHCEGRTLKEIGVTINRSPSAVQSRVTRMRRAFGL